MLTATTEQEEFDALRHAHHLTVSDTYRFMGGSVSVDTVKSWFASRESAKARNISKTALIVLKMRLNLQETE
jgi:Leu/Phe-tRNA-protein transferase